MALVTCMYLGSGLVSAWLFVLLHFHTFPHFQHDAVGLFFFGHDLSDEAFEVGPPRSPRALRSQRGVLEHRWLGATHPAGTPGHMTCLRGTAVSRGETLLMSLITPGSLWWLRVATVPSCDKKWNCSSTNPAFCRSSKICNGVMRLMQLTSSGSS